MEQLSIIRPLNKHHCVFFFTFRDCSLTSLPSGLDKGLPSLKYVGLQKNQIAQLGSDNVGPLINKGVVLQLGGKSLNFVFFVHKLLFRLLPFLSEFSLLRHLSLCKQHVRLERCVISCHTLCDENSILAVLFFVVFMVYSKPLDEELEKC